MKVPTQDMLRFIRCDYPLLLLTLCMLGCGGGTHGVEQADKQGAEQQPHEKQLTQEDWRTTEVNRRALDRASAPKWYVDFGQRSQTTEPQQLAVRVVDFAELPRRIQSAVPADRRGRKFAIVEPDASFSLQTEAPSGEAKVKVLDELPQERAQVIFEPQFLETGCPNGRPVWHGSLSPSQYLTRKSKLPTLIARVFTPVACGFEHTPEHVHAWRPTDPNAPVLVSHLGVRVFRTRAEFEEDGHSSYSSKPRVYPEGADDLDFERFDLVAQGSKTGITAFYRIAPRKLFPPLVQERAVVRFSAEFGHPQCYLSVDGANTQHAAASKLALANPSLAKYDLPGPLVYHWQGATLSPAWDAYALPEGANFAAAELQRTPIAQPTICRQHVRHTVLRTAVEAREFLDEASLKSVDFSKEQLIAFRPDLPYHRLHDKPLRKKKGALVVPVPRTIVMAYCCPNGRNCSTAPGVDQPTSVDVHWEAALSAVYRAPKSTRKPRVSFEAQDTSSCVQRPLGISERQNQLNPPQP